MKKILKHIILFLIQLIEKWEYSNLELNENDDSKKILETIPLEDIEIETDNGFKPVSKIHKTQPYTVWRIDLENGMFLEGANNHIVFDSLYNQIFIKDLNINDVIQTKEGPSKILKINKYSQRVSMYDITVDSNDHRFYSNGILSHNTTTIAAFFAWYMCFHTDRNLAILANKQATTTEIVSKVIQVFKGLPFFLKPGIENAGALGMRLDNGCMLTSQATTGTAQIGFTIHVLYIDEFAHIHPNITGEFWRSVYPTLSSSKISQCIITSTPNGKDNLFYNIWDKSVRGKNSFVNKRVDYWEVPGHDDVWAQQTKDNFGEEFFAQEFDLKFDVKQNTLLSSSQLNWIKRLSNLYEYNFKELEKSELDSELYENLKWRNDFDPNDNFNEKNDRFIISIDIAEGKDEDETKDSDYNIASIHRIKLKSLAKLRKLRKDEHQVHNMFYIDQIGVYRDNYKDEDILAKVCKAITYEQFNEEIVKLVVEMNFNGKAFLKEFSTHDKYHDALVMRSYHTAPVPGQKPPRKKAGFKVRSDKDYFCKLGKKLIRNKTLIPTEEETVSEFKSFGKIKSSWKGIAKHDDLVMAELNIARLYEEVEYQDWLYDFLDMLPDSQEKRYALELLKEPYDPNEVDDKTWASLYSDDKIDNKDLEKLIDKNKISTQRFIPGKSF